MANVCKLYDELKGRKDLDGLQFDNLFHEKLNYETQHITRKMTVLPTSKESEALPELRLLRDFSANLASVLGPQLHKNEAFEKYLTEECFIIVVQAIIKAKIYNDKEILRVADAMFSNLVCWATTFIKSQRPHFLNLLNAIVDKSADYYKINGKETFQSHMFGEPRVPDEKIVQFVDSLQEGTHVDCLKSVGSHHTWIRALFVGKDHNFIKVRYFGELSESFINQKYYSIAPLGSREIDFQWRMSLKVGDLVDYDGASYRPQWKLYKIVEVNTIELGDGTVSVNLSLQEMSSDGTEPVKDFYTQTHSVSVTSPALAKPNTRSNRINNSFDDSEDWIYLSSERKQRFAIMRQYQTYNSTSAYFIKYINQFGELGGFDVMIQALSSKENTELMGSWVRLFQSMADNLVEPFISKHGINIFNSIKEFGLESTEKNLRNFSIANLTAINESITVLAQRIFPAEKARDEGKNANFRIAFLCIKSDFLQKQLFGAKMIESVENKAIMGEGGITKASLAKEIHNEGLFEKIIKGHPSLIAKSVSILKMLFSERLITQDQMETLWDQIRKTDIESKKALISLLKEIILALTAEEIQFLLFKMLENIDDIQESELELLVIIKKLAGDKHKTINICELVNQILWGLLQRPEPGKKEFIKELSTDFVRNLDNETNMYIQKITEQLLQGKMVPRNLKLLRMILKDFQSKYVADVCAQIKETKLIESMVKEFNAFIESKAIETYPPVKQQAASSPDFINLDSMIQYFPPQVLKKINQYLKFFDALLLVNKPNMMMFTFQDFESIWEVLIKHCIIEQRIKKWINNVIMGEEKISQINEFHNFFHKNLSILSKPYRHEFFQFISSVFYYLNTSKKLLEEREVKTEPIYSYYPTVNAPTKIRIYHVLKVPMEKLDGFPQLWNLFIECEFQDLEHLITSFLAKLVTPGDLLDTEHCENIDLYSQEKQIIVNKCLLLLNSNDLKANNKAAGLLEKLMRSEEPKGFGDLKSLNNLKMAEKITVSFEKNSKYNKEKQKVRLLESENISELVNKIAQEYKISFDAVGLLKGGEQIQLIKYPSTLEQAGINGIDTLIVNELAVAEKPFIPLLDANNEFTPSALNVFKEIFSDFSTNGKMSRHDLANFTMKATDGSICTSDDERVGDVFNRFDIGNKDYLAEKEFIEFYLESTRKNDAKSQTVRKNLASLGYQSNLQTKKSQYAAFQSLKFSIRKQLIQNTEIYVKMLKTISEFEKPCGPAFESLANICYLLEYLTPAIDILQEIVQDPTTCLLSSIENRYILYYRLIILHSILTSPEIIEKIFSANDKVLTSQTLEDMILKLLDFELIEKLFKKFGSRDTMISPYILKIYEYLMIAGVSETKPEFAYEMKNFIAYFTNLKYKPNKKQKTTKKTTETQMKEEAEKEELNPEEENLKKISNILKKKWETFTKSINYDVFNNLLLDLSKQMTSTQTYDLSKSNKSVYHSIVTLICSSNQIEPSKLGEKLVDDSPLLEALIEGLLHQTQYVRIAYKTLYVYLSTNAANIEVKKNLLSRLIKCIKTQSNTRIHAAIEIASFLLVEVAEAKNSNVDLHTFFNLPVLFTEFGEKLMKLESQEKVFDDREDHNFYSILTFLDKIVTADPAILKELDITFKYSLLQFLFKNCLFNINGNKIELQQVYCKSKKSREAAITLLGNLCKGDSKGVLDLLNYGFGPLIHNLPDFNKSSPMFSDFDRRSDLGFLGIKNLGCICYMNAMLQQFYCTPAFRYGILMAEDDRAIELQDIKGRMIDDNVFHQIQKMFSYLDFSKRSDYNPIEFCLSYKDHSGEPVNCMIQQDAQEFLNMIFDKLETSLKKTPFKGILESVYGGKTANVFTCKNCKFVRTNEELFYNLSLEVKNCSNISDSFEKFIREETISDYLCSNCKNRCDITKRCYLKDLPNVLIVHLQKIIFDIEALVNVKISSKYEFPMMVNLRKYIVPPEQTATKPQEEGEENEEKDTPAPQAAPPQPEAPKPEIKDEEFDYKLVGVVIHKGNAEYGHYISLVNVNRQDPNRKDFNNDFWVEFDDSRISPFDMTTFDEECFGTTEEKEFPLISENTASKSAYILVYDKVKKSEIKVHFTPENLKDKEKLLSNLINKNEYFFDEKTLDFKTNFYNINTYLPIQYQKEIQEDNESVILEQQILSKVFTNNFVKILMCADFPRVHVENFETPKVDPTQIALAEIILKVAPHYLAYVLPYAEETSDSSQIVERIESSLAILPHKVLKFFAEEISAKSDLLINAMLSANSLMFRFIIAQYLSSVFTIVIKTFKITNLAEYQFTPEVLKAFGLLPDSHYTADQQTLEEHGAEVATTYIKKILDAVVHIITQSNANNSKKLGYLFRFLNRTATLNRCVAEHFLYSSVLNTICDFYNMLDSTKVWTSERLLSPLLLLFATTLKVLKEKKSKETDSKNMTDYYYYFVRGEFVEKILKEEAAIGDAVEELVKVVCAEDKKFTDVVAAICLKLLNKEIEVFHPLTAISAMLKIEDSFTEYRMRRILGVPRLEGELHKSNRFLYGMGCRIRLKSTIYNYPTLYFEERGLIELMFSLSETKQMIIISILSELAVKFPKVMEYLCDLPPHSYISGMIFDFWPDQIKKYSNRLLTYDSHKPEIKTFCANANLNVENFQIALMKYLETQNIPKEDHIFHNSDELSRHPLFVLKPNYLIGKTISSKMIFEFHEYDWHNSDRFAGVQVFVDRVSLIPSKPTGSSNASVPDDYDYSNVFTAEEKKNYSSFVDETQHKADSYLVPFGFEEEDGAASTKASRKTSEELESATGIFKNDDFVIRISLVNRTTASFFAKFKILLKNEQGTSVYDSITDLSTKTLLTIEKKTPGKPFGELKILASFLRVQDASHKSYDDSSMGELKQIFSTKI